MSTIEKLRERWNSKVGMAEQVFGVLMDKYHEIGRHYHTPDHILFCLEHSDKVPCEIECDRQAIELALWFHDAIYDTRRCDNEERSAEYAALVLWRHGFSSSFVDKVADLILITKTHTGENTIEGAVTIDCDLAIHRASQELYDKYEEDIRKEYSWVSDSIYKTERRRVLERFLNDPCQTSAGKENLIRAINKLDKEDDTSNKS
jgi:predicted metal-dependent HD superfamily phosphohydrolase